MGKSPFDRGAFLSHSLFACLTTGTNHLTRGQAPPLVKQRTDQMDDETARHNAKMAKKKAARDRMMEGKVGDRGLIIVLTGAGKGKSSSAFGMIFRCIAHEMPCAVVQFIKGAWSTGERTLIETRFADLCEFHAMGEGFTWETRTAPAISPPLAPPGKRQKT